jgi:hypothetical protein
VGCTPMWDLVKIMNFSASVMEKSSHRGNSASILLPWSVNLGGGPTAHGGVGVSRMTCRLKFVEVLFRSQIKVTPNASPPNHRSDDNG